MNPDTRQTDGGENPGTTTAAGLRGLVEDQQRALDALRDDVADLTDAVTGLADQLTTRGHRDVASGWAPWSWRDLDDQARENLRAELTEWVTWLRHRYPIAEQLPPCWARHSELVEELTALHTAWTAAYRDLEAAPTAPADFHDRWLPGMLTRIKTWGVHCAGAHHDRADGVYGEEPRDPAVAGGSRGDTPETITTGVRSE